MSSPFAQQITRNENKITECDSKISDLFTMLGHTGLDPTTDPCGLTGMTGLNQYFCEQISKIQSTRGVHVFRRDNAQTNHNHWNKGFTGGHEVHTADITTNFGTTYDQQIEGLRSQNDDRKNEFFYLYAKADSVSAKEMLIKYFFNINS